MINDQLETVMHLQVLNGGNLSTAYARLQQGKSFSRKKTYTPRSEERSCCKRLKQNISYSLCSAAALLQHGTPFLSPLKTVRPYIVSSAT